MSEQSNTDGQKPSSVRAGYAGSIMGCPSVQRPPVTAKAHLFADRPLVFLVLEAAAGQRVDALGLAQLHVLHLCVQEALKGQLLVVIVYRGRCLHLGRG